MENITREGVKRRIAKIVEREWREELESKRSMGIYREFKKEMKEEDYDGGGAGVCGVV